MFRKAIVAVDFSSAEAALMSCVPDLKQWGVESVVLCHVIELGRVQGAGYGKEQDYRDWLENISTPIREVGLKVTISVSSSGVTADELLAVARVEEADLVVVGSRSHNFIERIFLGSVAKNVIRKSDLPVLIIRLEPTVAGHAETCIAICSRALERILLATDLSTQSKSAEDAAVRLAIRAGCVDCLTVLPENADDVERTLTASKHRELIQLIKDSGGNAVSRIEEGDPVDVIVRRAQEGYTLIIVGKHGRHWITGRVVGNTAARVCEIAQRPVLIVPLQKD